MFKTKRYYKNCLAMQISNNKIINQKLINCRETNIARITEFEAQEADYKKEIKVLKSKVTRLTNQMKKLKEEN